MNANVALIIPCGHDHGQLMKLFDYVAAQTILPREIIIVDSSIDRGSCPRTIQMFCTESNVILIYLSRERCLPGAARNIGLECATSQWIAFLDIRTHPVKDWLERQLEFILKNDLSGAFGSSAFLANSAFSKLVRDGIYGRVPVLHLPGSVVGRALISRVGYFISTIRAGEDGDWIERIVLLGEPVRESPVVTACYKGLFDMTLVDYVRKWSLYYGSTRTMPFHLPQKVMLWWVFYFGSVFLSFNWNRLLANWDTQSLFYISDVTKISIIAPIVCYWLYRSFLIPRRRGVPIFDLLPIRFLPIGFICFLLDSVKFYSLLVPCSRPR